MTRDEHLQRCKGRALEYWKRGELADAVASMGSDLDHHPETRYPADVMTLGLAYAMHGDSDGVRRWIEGFN